MQLPILSLITFLPVLGMLIIFAIPGGKSKIIKIVTLVITGIQVILAAALIANYNYNLGGIFDQASFQFVEKWRWIDIDSFSWLGKIKVDYFLGADGISVPLVLLTAIVTFIATISSWTINKSVKGYFALFLLLDTGMMGVFFALDFFMFYIFWELMLLPMYLLSYRDLGRTETRIRSNQVFPLYIARKYFYSNCNDWIVFQHYRGIG